MRVVVADDSALFREGTAMVLTRAGFTVVGQACNAGELLALVSEHRPDVVVTDIRMPPTWTTEGIDAALEIRRDYPQVATILLSAHVDALHATRLLNEVPRRVGYLLKDRVSDVGTFAADVRRVADDGTVIDPELVSALLARRRRDEVLDRLTARERDVLELMAQGRSNVTIGNQLCLSARTVEANIRSIFAKFALPPDDASNRRVAAVLEYLRLAQP